MPGVSFAPTNFSKPGLQSKAPPLQGRRLDMDFTAERPKSPEADQPSGARHTLTPEYVQTDEKIWNHSLLAKVLLQMKDSEIAKLKFVEGSYKPFEYEKWIMSVNRFMKGLHPEIGHDWEKVSKEAEGTYFKYLKDLSPTRVSLQPRRKWMEQKSKRG